MGMDQHVYAGPFFEMTEKEWGNFQDKAREQLGVELYDRLCPVGEPEEGKPLRIVANAKFLERKMSFGGNCGDDWTVLEPDVEIERTIFQQTFAPELACLPSKKKPVVQWGVFSYWC